MKKKKYDGYKAFQYLEAGKDYKDFKLSKDKDRVEPWTVGREPRAADDLKVPQWFFLSGPLPDMALETNALIIEGFGKKLKGTSVDPDFTPV